MSADPAPEPGAPGQQQQPDKATQNGETAYLKRSPMIRANAGPSYWPWILAAFGILAVGTFVSYVVWRSVKPTDFMPSSNYAVYAGLFVMALALERVLQPFSGLFIPSVKAEKEPKHCRRGGSRQACRGSRGHQSTPRRSRRPGRRASGRRRPCRRGGSPESCSGGQKKHHHSQANRAGLDVSYRSGPGHARVRLTRHLLVRSIGLRVL